MIQKPASAAPAARLEEDDNDNDDDNTPPYYDPNEDSQDNNLNDYLDPDDDDDDDDNNNPSSSSSSSSTTPISSPNGKQRITIIGTGWAGHTLATSLDPHKFAITIISPSPSLVYTPLLARVAAAPAAPAPHLAEEPVRNRAGTRNRIRYVKARVESADLARRRLRVRTAFEWPRGADDEEKVVLDDDDGMRFDVLAVAPGCVADLLGDVPGAAEYAQFVRTAEDARVLRRRLLELLDKASVPGLTEWERRDRLRVVVVGGGPVGWELCVEVGGLVRGELGRLYPGVVGLLRVVVFDVGARIRSAYERRLYEYARERLVGREGVEVRVDAHVERVGREELWTKEDGRVPCGLVIWATANTNVPLVERLDAKKSSGGLVRLLTDSRLRVYKPEGEVEADGSGDVDDDDKVWEGVYGLGDACDIEGAPLPTTAEVAVQKARYLASVLNSGSETPYKYRPKGLATYLGGHDGIIQDGEWTGKLAWLSWKQGSSAWTRSFRTRSMMFLTWGFNRLFGTELARL
ncbi:fad nad-binding domain-containing protein [Diplodia corticola]|uniref:Fad nad-binding domain-containing protein n=1 Tax=Diplodia corticola TaxID=236234 RepID=A0A1J9QYQ1_9PEZI|nr:fad nad-binding domain-containing protein [Diplodia corticola]OJD34190.1 fad nad-binding domain-containing protein [Diplodia corticola]